MIELESLQTPRDLVLYKKYDNMAILYKKKHSRLVKVQVLLLSIIAFVSSIPPILGLKVFFDETVPLILLIMVMGVMVYQTTQNYVKCWQNARYIAETVLSNTWLLIWKCKPFGDKLDRKELNKKFLEINDVKEFMEISHLPCISGNFDSTIPVFIYEYREKDIMHKKEDYIKYRIEDQRSWYSSKADYNKRQMTIWFDLGLGLMIFGAILTILAIIQVLPSISFLGFITTLAANIFSWTQTNKFEELEVNYSISANELSKFYSIFSQTSCEIELPELVAKIEDVVSHEHKLWIRRMN